MKQVRHITELTKHGLRTEYLVLSQLQLSLSVSLKTTIAYPIALVEEAGQLFMTALPGKPLDLLLKMLCNAFSGPITGLALGSHARRVGYWLSQFHHETYAPSVVHSHTSFSANIEKQFSFLESRGFDQQTIDTVRKGIDKASRTLDGILAISSAKHGDFTPQNILVAPDAVAVVDFIGFTKSVTIYEDLGYFLADLLLRRANRKYSPAAIDLFAASFLSGYARELDASLLRIYVLLGLLNHIASDESQDLLTATESRRAREQLLLSDRLPPGWHGRTGRPRGKSYEHQY